MAQVTVNIHKRPYQVGCEDGQEQHVAKLAAYLDRRVGELAEKSGGVGTAGQIAEARLLVMAALLVADELGDTYDELEALRQAPPQVVADPASIKAADEARSVASAAKAQLAEAQTAMRAAVTRAGEADAARAASDELAAKSLAALASLEARATQAEAALQSAGARAAELEARLQAADSERAELRTAVAVFSVQKDSASAAEDALASGLDGLASRIEGMAERIERAAAN